MNTGRAADGRDPVVRSAIDWRVRMDSGEASEADCAALQCWLAADRAHEAAWERIGGLLAEPVARIRQAERVQAGYAAASLQALTSLPGSRRKLLSRSVASLALLGGGAWLLNRQVPLTNLVADHRTTTGERRTTLLADGSVLTLDARSAADVVFSAGQRKLRLRSGRVALRVAPDPLARPFAVKTAWGSVQTTDARLAVEQREGQVRVAVLERSAALSAADGFTRVLQAGESTVLGLAGMGPLRADALARAAWLDGVLDLRDEPLGAVVEALRPYQAGLIRITATAARLRVFGVLPLDDPGRALRSLADTLPIVVSRVGPWLTLIREA